MVDVASEIEQPRINNSKEILPFLKQQEPFTQKFETLLREAEEKRLAAQREQESRKTQAEKEVMDRWKQNWNFTEQQIDMARAMIIDEVKSHLPNVNADELNDAFYWLREAKKQAKPINPEASKRRWLGIFPPKKEDPSSTAFFTFKALTCQPPHFKARHPNLLRFLVEDYNIKHPKNQYPEDFIEDMGANNTAGSFNNGDWLQDIKLPVANSRETATK